MSSLGVVDVERLSVAFGGCPALEGIDLSAVSGEFLLLTGPSGSGKTTLLRCLNGIIPHLLRARMAGAVRVNGLDTREHPVARLAESVGFVFQNPETQLFNLTVWDEVTFGPRNVGLGAAEAAARARWALEATGATHLELQRLATLSGGEKQRIAIASVLALRPSILVLDEPTAHLDVAGSRAVLGTLNDLCRREGITVVLGEHRTGAAGRMAHRLVVLEGGHLVVDGPTASVFARRDLIYRLGIRRPADEPEQPWERLLGAPSAPSGIPPLVELSDVEAGYGKHPVLRGVDLALYPGEIVALVGDNGAGKTTTVRLMAGLLSPRRGKVLVNGRKPRASDGDVGVVLQNPMTQLFCETVEEEVSFGPANLGHPDSAAIEEALASNDLLGHRSSRVHRLSCGQQQRTVVASVLALGPRLLVLDEPTMGQDWRHLEMTMDYLRRKSREGNAVLLITHDFKLVHRYADRVILLRDGRVAASGRLRNGQTSKGRQSKPACSTATDNRGAESAVVNTSG